MPGGGGGGGTSLSCDTPDAFSLGSSGTTGSDPTSAAGSCGQCCYAGSDLDGDGDQDVSFSTENGTWYEFCNTSGITQDYDFVVDETNNDCNLQGAVFVGSAFNSTTIDCSNPEYQEYGSNPNGNADGFSFTGVTIADGECAYVYIDGYAGAACGAATIEVICPVLLEVDLTKFNIECEIVPTIEWTTKSEVNNDYFTIERSCDGINYIEVATINGNGNSSEPIDYAYYDHDRNNCNSKIWYYRLSQTDFNGKRRELRMLAITCNPEEKPFVTTTNDLIYISYAKDYTARLLTPEGRVIASQSSQDGLVTLSSEGLKSGVYVIVITSSEGRITKRVVITTD